MRHTARVTPDDLDDNNGKLGIVVRKCIVEFEKPVAETTNEVEIPQNCGISLITARYFRVYFYVREFLVFGS